MVHDGPRRGAPGAASRRLSRPSRATDRRTARRGRLQGWPAWRVPTLSATCTDTSRTCGRCCTGPGSSTTTTAGPAGTPRCGSSETWSTGVPTGSGWSGSCVTCSVRRPDLVHVLMGNHESLMLGQRLFPDSRFGEVWQPQRRPPARPGGAHRGRRHLAPGTAGAGPVRRVPADALRHHGLPRMGRNARRDQRHGGAGCSPGTTPRALRGVRGPDQPLRLRRERRRARPPARCSPAFGGTWIVHGHSIIGSTLTDVRQRRYESPISYAEDLRGRHRRRSLRRRTAAAAPDRLSRDLHPAQDRGHLAEDGRVRAVDRLVGVVVRQQPHVTVAALERLDGGLTVQQSRPPPRRSRRWAAGGRRRSRRCRSPRRPSSHRRPASMNRVPSPTRLLGSGMISSTRSSARIGPPAAIRPTIGT